MQAMAQILADNGSGELLYVIAVLVLAAGSAIFQKLREKMSGPPDRPRPTAPPTQGGPQVPRPTIPQRRATPPQRPAVPPQRPPVPTQRPAIPPQTRRPAVPPARPQPQRPQPRPAGMPQQPPARRPQPQAPQRPARPVQPAPSLKAAASAQEDEERLAVPLEAIARAAEAVHAPVATAKPARPVPMVTKLSTAELRRAFVLSEVLAPPLALRDQ